METKLNIIIPSPCHEQWENMTPNEKGAFCSKCCKTVIDFSEKSAEEITAILTSKRNKKVCGRFKTEQLSNSTAKLEIPFHLLPKNLTLSKAFAIALFVVFGTGLFSCTNEYGHTVGELTVIGDTVITENVNTSIDTTKNQQVLGEPAIINQPAPTDSTKCNLPKTIETKIGKVALPKK